MENKNEEFRQFEIALKTIMRGNISDYNDLIYILSYLCLIDSKLGNSPYNSFEKEFTNNSKNTLESFVDAVERRFNSYTNNPYTLNVRKAIDYLNEFRFSNVDSKELIDLLKTKDLYFYEKALISNVYGKGNINHPIRNEDTPIELVELFKYFAPGNKYLDIGCGNGNILVGLSYMKRENVKCDGIEINPRNVFISNLRLSLCNNVSSKIILEDYLTSHLNQKYSFITINMPFNLHIPSMKRNEINVISHNSKFDWTFSPATSSEWIYINKAINLLDENGRIVLVTPQTPLFKTGDMKFRKDLVDNNLIEYVIDMPAGTYPSTMVSYSIVVLNNNKQDNVIRFVNASECYIQQKINRKVDTNKIIEILESKSYKEISNSEVSDNEYKLIANRFIDLENKPKLRNAIQLCDLNIDITRGFQTFSRNDIAENGKYSIVTITDIDDNGNVSSNLGKFNTDKDVEKYILNKNDILVSTKGTRIKTCLIDKLENANTIYQGNLTLIRVKDERLDPIYLKLYLESERGQLELKTIQTGTTIISINTSELSKIEIPLVSIDEQKKIVDEYLFKKSEIDILSNRLSELKNNITDLVNQVFEGVKE